MKSGQFAVHLTRFGEQIGELIRGCVPCKKDLPRHNIARISDKWSLRSTEISQGIYMSVQVDILGP